MASLLGSPHLPKKNWLSKKAGVESKGVRGMVASTFNSLVSDSNARYVESAYVIGGADRVRTQECNDLSGSEASAIGHTCQNLVNRVERQRNGAVWRRRGAIFATLEELYLDVNSSHMPCMNLPIPGGGGRQGS